MSVKTINSVPQINFATSKIRLHSPSYSWKWLPTSRPLEIASCVLQLSMLCLEWLHWRLLVYLNANYQTMKNEASIAYKNKLETLFCWQNHLNTLVYTSHGSINRCFCSYSELSYAMAASYNMLYWKWMQATVFYSIIKSGLMQSSYGKLYNVTYITNFLHMKSWFPLHF